MFQSAFRQFGSGADAQSSDHLRLVESHCFARNLENDRNCSDATSFRRQLHHFPLAVRQFAGDRPRRERVPLFGEFGLVNQLGSSDYARPRKFRERLEGWLYLVRAMWPECPASMDSNGTGLWVGRANAVLTAEVNNIRSTS